MKHRRSDRPASGAFRLDAWISRWVPGGRIVLERLDRIAVAYLEKRYVMVDRNHRNGSRTEDSTDRRGA